MTSVLVTGGAGYIGSHACKALARAGYEPVVLDDLRRGHRHNVRWGPLVEADLLDAAAVRDALERHRPVAVMHFAALAYVGESMGDPGAYYRNNVTGSLSLLEAMRAARVTRLVHSSSCAVYGNPGTLRIDESQPLQPVNPYGASKAMVERIVHDFGRAHGIESIALRYFNAAGADPDGELGEEHDPEPHLVPLVLRAARDPAHPVSIFGDAHGTPDGTCVRDFVHVSDLAQAHVMALQALGGTPLPPALNLGTGRGHSVREIIASAARVTGRSFEARIAPPREGDPPHLVADAALAMRTLGWHPRFTGIDDILRSAWAWESQRART